MTATPPVRLALGGRRFAPIAYTGLAGLIVCAYVLLGVAQNGEFGFPLDDAWIHQVYARNLGTRLEFAFVAGQSSAGSTSPLWTAMLAVSYLLRLDYRVWTLGLGVALLGATAWIGGRLARQLVPGTQPGAWLVPLFLLAEWHLVWAAASGMEIVLFVFLTLVLFDRLIAGTGAVSLGLLAGLATWTRPEGLVLVGLAGAGLGVRGWEARRTLGVRRALARPLLGLALVFGLAIAPYWWFNAAASGTLLPSTFYAKAAEYSVLIVQGNFVARWLALFRQPLIGAQLLLAPGFLYAAWCLARARRWIALLPIVWVAALPALYAWRLPVEYQFGRYLMPIIPFIVVYGVAGTVLLLRKIQLPVLTRVWVLALAVLLVVFAAFGALRYAQSVAVVNCEMVATARWTAENLPPGRVAVHDIGAQGYFDSRPILDMAGLVSPEVIPFIRDEAKLYVWLRAAGASYAVFFPTWYPQLASSPGFVQVHETGCQATRALGEENLRVYELR